MTLAMVASPPARVRFADALRCELCKLSSVRSTYWALLAALVFNVGLAALLALFLPGQLSADDKASLDVVPVSLGGIHLSQVAFGVLGVLVIGSEYSTGMIRASLAAVPQRRRLLVAKMVALVLVGLGVAMVSSFAAYFVFEALVADESLKTALGDPGVLRALVGGGLYLAGLALLGLGLGAVIRSSAGAIAALMGLLFVPPLLLELFGSTLRGSIGPYVPMLAGAAAYSVKGEAHGLAPWAGLGVFAGYVVAALGVGLILINRRDA